MIERNLTQEHIQLMSTMTNEQRRIYNTIMKRVNDKKSQLFFICEFGGT